MKNFFPTRREETQIVFTPSTRGLEEEAAPVLTALDGGKETAPEFTAPEGGEETALESTAPGGGEEMTAGRVLPAPKTTFLALDGGDDYEMERRR